MLQYQAQAILGGTLPPADALSAATHVALALCNVADTSLDSGLLAAIGPLIKKVGRCCVESMEADATTECSGGCQWGRLQCCTESTSIDGSASSWWAMRGIVARWYSAGRCVMAPVSWSADAQHMSKHCCHATRTYFVVRACRPPFWLPAVPMLATARRRAWRWRSCSPARTGCPSTTSRSSR